MTRGVIRKLKKLFSIIGSVKDPESRRIKRRTIIESRVNSQVTVKICSRSGYEIVKRRNFFKYQAEIQVQDDLFVRESSRMDREKRPTRTSEGYAPKLFSMIMLHKILKKMHFMKMRRIMCNKITPVMKIRGTK